MGIFIWSLNIQEEEKEEEEGSYLDICNLRTNHIGLSIAAGCWFSYVAFITKSKRGKKRETNAIV